VGVIGITWPNFEILGPLITFYRIELSASNLVLRERTDDA